MWKRLCLTHAHSLRVANYESVKKKRRGWGVDVLARVYVRVCGGGRGEGRGKGGAEKKGTHTEGRKRSRRGRGVYYLVFYCSASLGMLRFLFFFLCFYCVPVLLLLLLNERPPTR